MIKFYNVAEQRSKLLDELEKHKQAVKSASDEIEKLKNDKGASAVELPPGTLLEDLTGLYLGAVVNFERAAQPACKEMEPASVAEILLRHILHLQQSQQRETNSPQSGTSRKYPVDYSKRRPNIIEYLRPQEDSLAEETSPNIDVPLPKKAKGLEASQEDEGQVAPNQVANESTPVPEDDMVDAADHCLKEECVDPGKDDIVESAGELPEELIEPVVDIVELQDDRIDVASDLDRPSEVLASDDHSKVQEVGEIQQQGNESGSELEEGELDADDQEGDDSIPPSMESPQIDEHAQTGENEESAIPSATEPREIDSSQGLDDGKNEEVATEDVDSTDKANDVINEQVSSELDQGNLNTVSTTGKASTSGAGESSVSRHTILSKLSAEP
ncbi:hypothetical protein Leryth_011351 [Lithospermum erythrorhizon]|nr:hypothetical protein Leryth_011351 [Lithospermum erythrorhizon]